MGRARRARQATPAAAVKPTPVVLPPGEYFRLMNLVKDVAIEIQAAESAVAAMKAKVRGKEQARDAYMAELTQRYPGLDFLAGGYFGDDATCTLTPAPAPFGKAGQSGSGGARQAVTNP